MYRGTLAISRKLLPPKLSARLEINLYFPPQRRFSNYVLCPRSVFILFLRPYNGLTRRFIVVPFCFSFDPLVFDVLLYVLKVGFLLYVQLFIKPGCFLSDLILRCYVLNLLIAYYERSTQYIPFCVMCTCS